MPNFSSRSTYATVSSALATLESDVEPAECHGMLCGILCSPDGFQADLWLRHLTGYTEPSEPSTRDLPIADVLNDLITTTLRGMDSDECAFELLLPDDDESLLERAVA